jgi:hypothetical protein
MSMYPPVDVARLRTLLAALRPLDHTGRTVGRTLYVGDGVDDLIGMMDNRAYAELVLLAYQYAREALADTAAPAGEGQ